jgi:bacteriocin biosynthesis cyclodehydratase domain-containing protein
MRPSAGRDAHIESPSQEDRRLLAALDGSRTHEELIAEFGEEFVRETLAQMQELELLDDAADDKLISAEAQERFDGQLRYFSDVTKGPSPSECQARLEGARVAVLGVGGLGGWSALALACHGVGEMLLLDFDHVELSNLNRQVLYIEADIGRPKVQGAAERLAAFNSAMRIETREQRLDSQAAVQEAVAGADVVIDAVDWPALDIERWVNAACFAEGIPYVAMSHFPPVARVGPFYVPGETGCYECQEKAFRDSFPLYDVVVEQQRGNPSPAATLGAACGLIGSHVALDIVHYLTKLAKPSTHGATYICDLRTMEAKREPLVPVSGCAICGGTVLATEGGKR